MLQRTISPLQNTIERNNIGTFSNAAIH